MERRTISIFANDLSNPTVCITYNVRVDEDVGITYARTIQFWLRNDRVDDLETLMVARNLHWNILDASGNATRHMYIPFSYRGCVTVKSDIVFTNKEFDEKIIYVQYQKLYARVFWRNYDTKEEKFNTERLATVMKPYRNFVLATKEFLDEQIKNALIQKGEENG